MLWQAICFKNIYLIFDALVFDFLLFDITGINHQELVSLAEKHFAGLPSSSKSFDVSPCKYTGSEVCFILNIYCNFATVGIFWVATHLRK